MKILMTSFAHTESTFEKVVAAWYMQNLVLYSLAQTVHIVNSSGEIKFWKFQWRHSRIPEIFRKAFEVRLMKNLVLCSLAQTAH